MAFEKEAIKEIFRAYLEIKFFHLEMRGLLLDPFII
jgi:hypothetical protein